MKNVAAALVKAQRKFGPALKTATNPHFRSKYADLSACVEAVIDALNENGIALVQRNSESADGVTVETVFVHESGEMLSSGPLHVPASKQDPQGYGSALTYARRYSLMAACGIAPEDDDGNAASKRPETRREPGPRGVVNAVLATSEAIPEERVRYLSTLADELIEEADNGRTPEALVQAIDAEKLDDMEKIFLWGKLPSNLRTAIKAAQKRQREAA